MVFVNFDDVGDLQPLALFPNSPQAIKGLFSNVRISQNSMPENLNIYDIREDGYGKFCSIERQVAANFAGCFITPACLTLHKGFLDVTNNYSFL